MKIKLIYLIVLAVGLIGWRIFFQIRSNYIPYSEDDYIGISEMLDVDSGIVAVLVPNKKYYRIGEIPDLDLILINRTDSVIYLPGSLDGSPVMTRLPYCDFEVLNRKVNRKRFIDVNPNPLIKEDLVRLAPNECFNAFDKKTLVIKNYGYDSLINKNVIENSLNNYWSPFDFGHKRILWPGIYKVRVVYSTIPNSNIFAGWNIQGLFKQNENYIDSIPEIEIMSNIVTLRYSLF